MKHYFIILFLLFYYCGENNPASSTKPDLEFHYSDQEFINDLLVINNHIKFDDIVDDIITITFDSVLSYYRIKELNLINRALIDLPSSIKNLDSLRYLDISNNQITTIPYEICDLSINTILIDNNRICSRVPTCISEIINYETKLCDYHYNDNDEQFLEEFINTNWSGNNFDSLYQKFSQEPLTFWEPKEENNSDIIELRIVKLDWDLHSISIIPETIYNLNELIDFDISSNSLQSMPSGITALSKLEDLKIYQNNIEYLPTSVGNLSNLISLEAHNNQIKELPNSIGSLVNLNKLTLQNNNLDLLPETLCDFFLQIQTLFLECNEIEIETCSIDIGFQGDHSECDSK